jgi:hypothetical protein
MRLTRMLKRKHPLAAVARRSTWWLSRKAVEVALLVAVVSLIVRLEARRLWSVVTVASPMEHCRRALAIALGLIPWAAAWLIEVRGILAKWLGGPQG